MKILQSLVNEALADWRAVRTDRQLADCMQGAGFGLCAISTLAMIVLVAISTL